MGDNAIPHLFVNHDAGRSPTGIDEQKAIGIKNDNRQNSLTDNKQVKVLGRCPL